MRHPGSTRHRVAVLALPEVIGFDLAIPPLVLGAAVDSDGNPLYDVRVCALSTDPVPTTQGYGIVPECGPEAMAEADTVIVTGTRLPGPRTEGTVSAELVAAFADVRPDARIMSICTGSFVLAAMGLLDGRRATTHWSFADTFRALYPRVLLDEDPLFVEDGNIWTAAGLAAGIDLCLHIIRADHGSEPANRAARYCVVQPWREGGQSQFIERQVPDPGSDGTAGTRAWALTRLDQPLDLTAMAANARMSVRTFTRRFKAETALAPGAWLLQQRLRHARHLLETTDLPIDAVARCAGIGTAASLRHHMRLSLGIPPLAYRKSFRAPHNSPATDRGM
ncbi:helix-turn-helix domain-containing protein [Nocardia panacis]|uniref:Helix-turn-helix domain-containing protein n=1 Tax=Nocardia panacis TaxID=2340916 RepID=A0A3A4KBD8_9NOCA|nr:helix-turn-helix domain-containing protein [Nocardia panacis]RJO69491.1 helix-turn-helix domain-containing protein [Nocardia panacis]